MPDSFATTSDGLLLVANGINPVLVWDGLTEAAQEAGIAPPDTAPTLAASGSGTITGTYYGYLRYLDARGNVSDLSPLSGAIVAASNGTVTYTGVETPPLTSKVVRRQLLRNTAGQTSVFYVDVDTNNLVGSSFSSTNTDSTLQSGTAVALLDTKGNALANTHAQPPDTKAFLVNHHERVFMAGEVVYDIGSVAVTTGSTTVTGQGTEWPDNFSGRFLWLPRAEAVYEIASVDADAQTLTLTEAYQGVTEAYTAYAIRAAEVDSRNILYSEAALPESWPVTNAVTPQEDGDEITGLLSKGSFLFILERRHIHRLTYQDGPQDDGMIFLTAGRGCVNNRCHVVVDDRAFFLDECGVYAFDGGQTVEDLSGPIQDIFETTRSTKAPRYKIRWEASRWFHASYDQTLRVIRFFVTLEGTGVPRHALALDIERKTWWVEEYPFPVGASCEGTLSGQRRVFVGGPAGSVYALGEGTLDRVAPGSQTCRGTVTSAGVSSLTDSGASFASSAVNAPVAIASGRGKGQRRVVTAVTATTLTLDRPWLVRPDDTSVYQLGGVQYRYRTGWFRYVPMDTENGRRLEVMFEPTAYASTLDARLYLDRATAATVWKHTQTTSQADGFAVTSGDTDWSADLTKAIGLVQRRIDGRKELFLDGPRLVSWEFAGVTNLDDVTIYQVTIDGVQGK